MSFLPIRLRAGLAFGWPVAMLITSFAAARQEAPVASSRPLVYAAEVEALIHPVSAEFIGQTIDRADANDADLVVFTLRTPGGSSMRLGRSTPASSSPPHPWSCTSAQAEPGPPRPAF